MTLSKYTRIHLSRFSKIYRNKNNCPSRGKQIDKFDFKPLYMLPILFCSLDGILIGYQNVKILMDDRTGLIPMGVADIRINVSVEFFIFQPKIGGFLQGQYL